jgi:hypothetical protein
MAIAGVAAIRNSMISKLTIFIYVPLVFFLLDSDCQIYIDVVQPEKRTPFTLPRIQLRGMQHPPAKPPFFQTRRNSLR